MTKIILTLFLLNSIFIHSQTKTFVRDYTYKAGEADSKLSSKTLALKEVKALLLEEIGVYLSSEFENKTEQKQVDGKIEFNQLTKSSITTLAAGITKTTILDEKWDGETYYLKAEIIVDVDDAKKKLKELVNDKAKTKELQELQEKNKEATDEIDKLKKELEYTKANNKQLTEKDKNRVQEDYNAKINILNANEWFQKGYNADVLKEYQNAIIYYSNAIQLNPDFAQAYNNRGCTNCKLQNYIDGMADFNKVIQLNPVFADIYFNRGNAKFDLQDYKGSIDDYTKAIQQNPNDVDIYYNRGNVKFSLKDYKGAIEDYTKVIKQNPKYSNAYYNRGNVKLSLRKMNGACEDWSKAGELGISKAYDNIKKYCNK